jgi:hypothetical protein
MAVSSTMAAGKGQALDFALCVLVIWILLYCLLWFELLREIRGMEWEKVPKRNAGAETSLIVMDK